MIILDGKNFSKETNEKLKSEIANASRTPGLAIIMVGNRKDSLKYVEKYKFKIKINLISKIFVS